VSEGMWKAVETGTGEVRMVKVEKRRRKKEKARKKRKEKAEKKKEKEKPKKECKMKVRKVVEEWKIWDEKEEVAKLEAEARKVLWNALDTNNFYFLLFF